MGCPLDVKNREGNTALMKTIQLMCITEARMLLESGADPDIADHRKYTPLHFCVLEEEYVHGAVLLIQHGAFIDAEALDGSTTLDLAFSRKAFLVVSALLHSYAKISEASLKAAPAEFKARMKAQYQCPLPLKHIARKVIRNSFRRRFALLKSLDYPKALLAYLLMEDLNKCISESWKGEFSDRSTLLDL